MTTPNATNSSSANYDTPNPSEHYDSSRTSRFLETRAVEEIVGAGSLAEVWRTYLTLPDH